jgi:hypothetical protein
MTRSWRAWVAVLCAIVACATCACSSGGAGSGRKPDEVGGDIGQLYVKLIDEAAPVVAAEKSADALRGKVAALKDKYVRQFLPLGKERAAMKPGDREACDRAAQARMMQVASDKLDALSAAESEWRKADAKLADEIGALRRLTVYASFERLRALLPDEAKRLGVP